MKNVAIFLPLLFIASPEQVLLNEVPAAEPNAEDYRFDAECKVFSPSGSRGKVVVHLTDVAKDHSAHWDVKSDNPIFSFGEINKSNNYVYMYKFVYLRYDQSGNRIEYRIELQSDGSGQKFSYWNGEQALGQISILKWEHLTSYSKISWKPAEYIGTGSCRIFANRVSK
jgi:hypothetical protein